MMQRVVPHVAGLREMHKLSQWIETCAWGLLTDAQSEAPMGGGGISDLVLVLSRRGVAWDWPKSSLQVLTRSHLLTGQL